MSLDQAPLLTPQHEPQLRSLALTDALIMSFDLETTGVNPQEARIVQVGVSYFYQGRAIGKRQSLVNPQVPIPPQASEVHGITDEAVQNAAPFSELMERLRPHFFGEALEGYPPPLITGYNISSYDLPLFEAELRRAGASWSLEGAPAIDLFSVAKWHLRHLPGRKLVELCERFHIRLDQAHDALADAHASGQLMGALLNSGYLPSNVGEAIDHARVCQERTEREFQEFQTWLYPDRQTNELLLGKGKHQNTPLRLIDPGYLKFLLERLDYLSPRVKELFQQRIQAG
jgi:DNA polymerase III subunit epsilon